MVFSDLRREGFNRFDVRDNYTSLLLGGTATNRPNFHLELKLGGRGKGRWSRLDR